MLGSRIIEGKSQEFFEGVPIVYLGFQLSVGIDVKPLLKKQAFHKKNRRIGFVALGAFVDGRGSCRQVFNFG
jgi:hypothetical protein